MKKKLSNIWTGIDYGGVLPFFGIFPYRVGRALAYGRGCLNYHLKRDWRSFTFGDTGLYDRAYRAYKTIVPGLGEKEYKKLLRQRYAYQSIEEFEAALLAKGKFPGARVRYEGLEKVKEYVKQNPNVVFITSHFGNSLAGVSFLEVLGVPILGMSSNVTKNENVHRSITKLYEEKYKAIAKHLNGGDVIDIEGNRKTFMNFLKNKGSLIIVADLPPTRHNKIPAFRKFFGETRGFASGAAKFCESANTRMIPFVSFYEKGEYVMRFAPLDMEPYAFLQEQIAQRPSMWWASDLLELYGKKKENIDEV